MAHIYKNTKMKTNYMNINQRNKKVALSRWQKIHLGEKSLLKQNSDKYFLKARLCGFLAGDGSVMIRKDNDDKMHYVVRFFPDHDSLIEPFTESLFKVYNKKPIIKKNYSHNGLICYSKVVVEDLLGMTDFGLLEWRIPFNILVDKKSKIEWLRAFFDCEAYVGKNHLKIQTVNKKGMDDLEKLLLEFGIKSKRYIYHPKKKNWNNVYILLINSKSDRLKFLNTIGFNHKLKLSKLQNMLESPNLVWHR